MIYIDIFPEDKGPTFNRIILDVATDQRNYYAEKELYTDMSVRYSLVWYVGLTIIICYTAIYVRAKYVYLLVV